MIPYGATFTVFFQYGLPAIRMAAISKTLGARTSGECGWTGSPSITPKASKWSPNHMNFKSTPIGDAHDHLAHAWGFLCLYYCFYSSISFQFVHMNVKLNHNILSEPYFSCTVIWFGTILMIWAYLSSTRCMFYQQKLPRFPVFYIGTHDSIDLGEDGPTHQPVAWIQQVLIFQGYPP